MPTQINDRRIAFTVRGRVQGVGFRFWTQNLASELKIAGWVRNQFNGSVEGEAQGSPEAIERFIDYLHQGPSFSNVSSCNIQEKEIIDSEGFHIRF